MRRLGVALSVLLVAAYGAYALSKSRSYQLFGAIVNRVEVDRPMVALTFDDGPTPAFTDEVLAMLAAAAASGTFFLTGAEMERYPEGTRAISAAGHEIGNHSHSHRRMVVMAPSVVRAEIAQTDAAIRAAGYEGPILFRPPYGKKLVVLPWVLSRMGRPAVMWSIEADPLPGEAPEDFAARIVAAAEPGDIVLMHLMYSSRATDRAALPLILEGLRQKGLEPVRLSDLIEAGGG